MRSVTADWSGSEKLAGPHHATAGGTGTLAPVTVVVVGAGPVGVTAALLLARRGIDVLVLDRHRAALSAAAGGAPGRRGAAGAAGRRGRRRVHRDQPRRWPACGCWTADTGRWPSSRAAPGEHGWPQASMFSQPDLEAVLRAALAAEPRATLRGGVEVLHVEHVAGPVRLTVRDRTTGARSSRARRRGARLRRRPQHGAPADRRADARPRPGRALAGRRPEPPTRRCRSGRACTRSATRPARPRSCRSPGSATARGVPAAGDGGGDAADLDLPGAARAGSARTAAP